MLTPIKPEYVRSILNYDPETGIFTWKVKKSSATIIGSRAGHVRQEAAGPYRYIKIDREKYAEHRLAWLYMTDEPLPPRLDHKDLDGTNNIWENIRAATGSQNIANQGLRSNNTSGSKGVGYNARTDKWFSQIRVNYKLIHLGTFADFRDAEAAYATAASKYFGEFARTK
jgi:hypothetical protein